MTNANFEDILSVGAETIEKPKPLPEGTYEATVKSFDFTTVGQKDTPVAKFAFEISGIGDDVDLAEIEAAGDIIGKTVTTMFFLTDDAKYRLVDFCVEHVGIDMAGKTLGQVVEETKNMPVGITVKHEASKDGSQTFTRVQGTHAI